MTLVALARPPGGPSPHPSFLAGVMLAIAIVGLVYEGVLAAVVPPMGPF